MEEAHLVVVARRVAHARVGQQQSLGVLVGVAEAKEVANLVDGGRLEVEAIVARQQ